MASRWRAATAVLVMSVLAAPAWADVVSAPVVTDRTRATLVADDIAAAPGQSVPVALRLQLKPGWHTYWRNPGDSGEPASVTLHVLGRDITGPQQWPTPERIDIAGIVSYGHHGDVALVTNVPVPPSAKPGTVIDITADATWLVCEKVCVPEHGHFTLGLPVTADAKGASTMVDPPLPAAAGLFERTPQAVTVRVPKSALDDGDGPVREAYLFPERGDLIDHSAPQVLREQGGDIVLALTSAQVDAPAPTELRGILSITRQRPDGKPQDQVFQLTARPTAAAR